MTAGALGVADVLVPTGTTVGVDVPLAELVCDEEEPWLALIVHVEPPVQEYPNGQQVPLPQLGKVAERLVVYRPESGCNVIFCFMISQDMGFMIAQLSSPLGQQSRVVLLASTKHVVDAPQQNPEGTPGHCVQVACLSRRPCGEVKRAVIELGKTAMKLRNINIRNRSMMRLCARVYLIDFSED